MDRKTRSDDSEVEAPNMIAYVIFILLVAGSVAAIRLMWVGSYRFW